MQSRLFVALPALEWCIHRGLERAGNRCVGACTGSPRAPAVSSMRSEERNVPVDLSLTIGRGGKQELRLSNPVMVASGTFSNGLEFAKRFDVDALGGLVSKGTTLLPRRGNPQPRTVETASGMINSIGFQNIGVGALISEIAPVWSRWQVPALVNIMGNTVAEYGQLADRLEGI